MPRRSSAALLGSALLFGCPDGNGNGDDDVVVPPLVAPLEIQATRVPQAVEGRSFDAQFRAIGGAGQGHRWRVAFGGLPPGVSLVEGGQFAYLRGSTWRPGDYECLRFDATGEGLSYVALDLDGPNVLRSHIRRIELVGATPGPALTLFTSEPGDAHRIRAVSAGGEWIAFGRFFWELRLVSTGGDPMGVVPGDVAPIGFDADGDWLLYVEEDVQQRDLARAWSLRAPAPPEHLAGLAWPGRALHLRQPVAQRRLRRLHRDRRRLALARPHRSRPRPAAAGLRAFRRDDPRRRDCERRSRAAGSVRPTSPSPPAASSRRAPASVECNSGCEARPWSPGSRRARAPAFAISRAHGT